MNLTAKKLNNV